MRCSGRQYLNLINGLFRLSLPRHYFRTFQTLANIPKKKNAMTLENMENAFIEKLKELISTLLRQERIFGVVLNKHTNVGYSNKTLYLFFFRSTSNKTTFAATSFWV
jgi:hypothetical protein